VCWPRSRRRCVATLVACGVPPDEVFLAVTVEVVRLLPADFARMGRYEPGGTVATVAAPARTDEHFPSAAGWPGAEEPRQDRRADRPLGAGGQLCRCLRPGRRYRPGGGRPCAVMRRLPDSD
jgi:hypothetical protein